MSYYAFIIHCSGSIDSDTDLQFIARVTSPKVFLAMQHRAATKKITDVKLVKARLANVDVYLSPRMSLCAVEPPDVF